MKLLGLDEAGRSPIIGSISIGGVIADSSKVDSIDGKDSKNCTKIELKDKFNKIKENYDIYHKKVTPKEIDGRDPVTDTELNLNDLEVYYMLKIVEDTKITVDKILVDNMDRNKEEFLKRAKLVANLTDLEVNIDDYKWKVKHKLDELNKLVGAGSIVAKHYRDKEIKNLKSKGKKVGSGQVSDPTTQKYVYKHLKDKDNNNIRFSWKTINRLENSKVCPNCNNKAVVEWGKGYKCANCGNTMNK